MESAGTVIAELREARGWTQATLAGRLGVDPATVSRIERGLRGLGVDDAPRWLDALDANREERERFGRAVAGVSVEAA